VALYEIDSVPYDGAAAIADASLVAINVWSLSEDVGPWELDDACGIWIPCDSGLGGVAGGVG